MRKLLLCSFLLSALFCGEFAVAQQNDPVSYAQMPKVIPPSPEVSALFKFADYPVSHSTGIPSISIPLYTVKCGNLSLPISIDYHASGRQYSDMTGPIGIGWTLNAGGTISRTVFGSPDEDCPVPGNLRKASSLNNKDDYWYLAELYYNGSNGVGVNQDTEYDLFSYSLPGLSGSFVMYMGSPSSLTLNKVKISGGVNYFTITGEDGTQYIFQSYGNSSVSASYINYNSSTKTAWFLDRIQSADGKHTIDLTYEAVRLYNTSTSHYVTTGETMIVSESKSTSYIGSRFTVKYQNTNPELSFSALRLKEINFESGKVEFENEEEGGKLKKICIKDASNTTVKTYSLTHDLLDITAIENYKLSSIATTSGSKQTDTYRFDYYPTLSPPSSFFKSNQHDYWGYLNNNSAPMSFFIPTVEFFHEQSVETVGHHEVNRESDETKMKSGVLKKITYPTGNSTEFIYEINKFMYGSQIRNCGGLRIKQIITTDDVGQSQLRTFQYCPFSGGYGSLVEMQYVLTWGFESLYLDVSGTMSYPGSSNYSGHSRRHTFLSEFPQDYSYYANQPIFYSNVVEYKGDVDNNTGKIEYQYANPYSDSYTNYIPSPNFSGNTSSSIYPNFMPKTFEYNCYYSYIRKFGSLWKDRNLTSQIEYSKINGTYSQVKSTTYTYTDVTTTPITGLKMFKYIEFRNDDYRHQTEELFAREFGMPIFQLADYTITRGRQLLTSSTVKETHGGNTISTTRNYEYDSNYLQKSVTTTNSSGKKQVEEFFYPTDSAYKDQAVYSKMINLNMLNIPLKQKVIRNGRSNSNLTSYTDLGSNYIKPSQLSTQKDNNTAEVRIQYNKYDNYGNPVAVVKDNTLNVVYLWGYQGMYPVAEIINATYTEVETALGVAPESISSEKTYNSKIDNLRNQLPNAQITIYKYKKLVGPISVTDPTGLITSYTYDSFNRLEKVSVQEPGGTVKTVGTNGYNYRNN